MTGRKVVLETIEDKKLYSGIVEPTFPLTFNYVFKKNIILCLAIQLNFIRELVHFLINIFYNFPQ
jgi:hypothetical protein